MQRPHPNWTSPMESLERFVLAHVGSPVGDTRKKFLARFTGKTIGGGLAMGDFVYDPKTRGVVFTIVTTGVPDGIGLISVESEPIE